LQILNKITSRHIQKEAAWIIVGQAGTAVAGILGIKLLTNVLGPAEFGKLALANTLIALISTNFLFGPLGAGRMRFWAISKSKGCLKEFYAASKQLKQQTIAISIIVSFALTVIAAFFKGMEWAALFAVSTAAGIFTGWLGLRMAVFTAARKRPLAACLNIGNAFSRPVIAAGLVLLISVSAFWAMAGYLVAAILLVVVAEWFYVNIVSGTSDKITASDIKKDIISFSWPFVIFASFSWVHLSCDKWALQSFHGPEIVGAFAVVSQLAVYPLVFGSGFLSTLIVPVAYERAGDLTQYQKVMSAYRFLAFIAIAYISGLVLLMWFFFIFHHKLILLISNIKFAEFSFLLPWITGAWGLFYLGQVLSNFGMLANKTSVYIAPKIAAAIIAAISTFYLSARYGVVGVAWGIALAGFIYAFWCVVVAIKLFAGVRIEAN
jgi:O-antigen/teichoic acid export membrane protein